MAFFNSNPHETEHALQAFNQIQSKDYQYTISDLKTGIYIVKAVNIEGQQKTLKLIKN